MKEMLYGIVELIAKIHSYLLRLNDSYEYNFTDKELHFLVIGFIGMGFIFVVYPFFKWLAKKDHVMVIAWIYVFTLILVITFAIEIGQKITHTGNMEFADIVTGIFGFIAMFLIFAAIREIYKAIKRGIKRLRQGKNQGVKRSRFRDDDSDYEEEYEADEDEDEYEEDEDEYQTAAGKNELVADKYGTKLDEYRTGTGKKETDADGEENDEQIYNEDEFTVNIDWEKYK